MLTGYLIMAAVTGVVFEWMRPAKFDDIGLWAKILIPTAAGLLWPVILSWIIIDMIKEYWT